MTNISLYRSKLLLSSMVVLLLFGVGRVDRASALPLDLNDTPIFLLNNVEPNIVLTFDDSGSMGWAYLPDGISGISGHARGCSSEINKIYYNPTITYDPPVKHDGTLLNTTPTTFASAYINGFNTGAGTTDLGAGYQPSWDGLTSYGTCGQTITSTSPAFYFNYNPTGTGCSPAVNTNNACYTRVNVTGSSAEAQNFANWYSYYRTRNLLAKTAGGRAFSRLGTGFRLVGQHINNTGTSTATPRFTTTIPAMQKFCENPSASPDIHGCPGNSTARSGFFARLYNSPHSGGTPLRAAMQRAGDYYTNAGPYQDVPGTGAELSCRQNFHVLFTDGYWNGAAATGDANRNNDGSSITALPDGKTFSTTASPPYNDSYTGTLADIAFYYWATDLRTGSTDNVRPHLVDNSGTSQSNLDEPTNWAAADYWNPVNNPADWQHMVNFTIGLGINGVRNPANYFDPALPAASGDWDELKSGTLAWTDPISNTQGERIDDLWHAAVNSRGRYFSAGDPNQLVDTFTNILNDIGARIGSASSLASNSGTLSTTSKIYQARFHSNGWAGQLRAFQVDPTNGTVSTTADWDVGEVIRTQNFDTGREIITFNTTSRTGAKFRWNATDLSAAQKANLDTNPFTLGNDGQGQARLEYLRGSGANEGLGNNYRTRVCYSDKIVIPCPASEQNTGRLADIVNSAPIFVGGPPFFYPDSLESGSYSSFANTYRNRSTMLYFGANGGMLHAIDAGSGQEKLAYVPGEVYPNLSKLTSPTYTHNYYVDGTPTAGDVFVTSGGTSRWRTVLIGGLRKGGKGYYALDVTDPTQFNENNAASLVMWEFTDVDLGFTYARPVIAKMNNGKWAAIFGNGYNNTGTGTGVLYIVFIEDGLDGTWSTSDFIKIDTGIGDTGTPNGLGTVAAVDMNRDFKVDVIYAGDLRGNMWRFDVSSTTASNWTGSGARSVLFAATDASTPAAPQPITTRPVVSTHPAALGGNVVYFGTGKFLETTDNIVPTGMTTQTFYAVWDKGTGATVAVSRSDLLQQSITGTFTAAGGEFREITNNTMVWRTASSTSPDYLGWMMNLPDNGERVIADPVLLNDRVIFATYIPSNQRCRPGGEGWIMELAKNNGGHLDLTFDVDGDGDVDANDVNTATNVAPAGAKVNDGGTGTPIILTTPPAPPGSGTCNEYKYTNTTTGGITKTQEKCQVRNSREAWQQTK